MNCGAASLPCLAAALVAGAACGGDRPAGEPEPDAWTRSAIERATKAYQEGRFEQVEPILADVLRRPAPPADAQWVAGSAAFELGRYPVAARRLDEALRRKPAYLTIASALGYSQYRLGEYEASRRTYGSIVAARPDAIKAHYGLGLVALSEDRGADAREHAERALRLQPGDLNARLLMASVLHAEQRWGEAAAALRELAAEQPSNDETLYRLGQVLAELGQDAEAEQVLARHAHVYTLRESLGDVVASLASGADSATLRARQASLLLQLGELEAARRALARGLEQAPQDATLRELQERIAAQR